MKILKKYLYESWWLFLFFVLCYALYEEGVRRKDSDFHALNLEQEQLRTEKTRELARKENLEHQISSQSDPAWVELILMRDLGLVPEGQKKVVFTWK